MKPPTTASLKKVSPENLAASGRSGWRRFSSTPPTPGPTLSAGRMELAAEQGADHLALEIDKRLASLETSRGKVSWRKRASFVGDLDILRRLISERLAGLDPAMALARMWLFMDLARRLGVRVRDRDGALGEVFVQAARDIGALLAEAGDAAPSKALVEAIGRDPTSWLDWLPIVLDRAPPAFAGEVLRRIADHGGTSPGWLVLALQAAQSSARKRTGLRGHLFARLVDFRFAPRAVACRRRASSGH